jgi:hypothetical protein
VENCRATRLSGQVGTRTGRSSLGFLGWPERGARRSEEGFFDCEATGPRGADGGKRVAWRATTMAHDKQLAREAPGTPSEWWFCRVRSMWALAANGVRGGWRSCRLNASDEDLAPGGRHEAFVPHAHVPRMLRGVMMRQRAIVRCGIVRGTNRSMSLPSSASATAFPTGSRLAECARRPGRWRRFWECFKAFASHDRERRRLHSWTTARSLLCSRPCV